MLGRNHARAFRGARSRAGSRSDLDFRATRVWRTPSHAYWFITAKFRTGFDLSSRFRLNILGHLGGLALASAGVVLQGLEGRVPRRSRTLSPPFTVAMDADSESSAFQKPSVTIDRVESSMHSTALHSVASKTELLPKTLPKSSIPEEDGVAAFSLEGGGMKNEDTIPEDSPYPTYAVADGPARSFWREFLLFLVRDRLGTASLGSRGDALARRCPPCVPQSPKLTNV